MTCLLGFNGQHVRIAQLGLSGAKPPATAGVSSGCWQEMVDGHGEMAIVLDADGAIVAACSAFLEMAASAHQNWGRWTLLDQAVRDNWPRKAAWTPRPPTGYMPAGVHRPASGPLTAIRQVVRDDPIAQHILVADSGIGGRALPFRHRQWGTRRVRPLLAVASAATLITLPFMPDDHDAALNASA
ncbi:hypothetical protein AB0D98_18765 [Streptomyces sp. NPDC047987]|uniref:hypothetical protein n=1 Tax=unclassified Streptomyces TaxID=2593676 RepID=UPI0034389CEE